MQKATQVFRLCIVSSLLLGAVGSVIDLVFPNLVPEALRQAQEGLASESLRMQDYLAIGLGVPLLITLIAAAFGLYRFHPWAPRVALYVTIAGLFFYPLVDAEIYSPATALLNYASAVLWGVVLTMAFLPPLNARFRGLPANSSMQPTGQERPAAD